MASRKHRVIKRKTRGRRRLSRGRAWKLICSPADFEPLRSNEAFHRLVDLGRHTNALRCAVAAVFDVHHEDTPSAHRQRSSTFFLVGGILFEAFQLVNQLRKHFGAHPAWEFSFARFGSEELLLDRLEQGGDLHILRNHTSFHVLPMVAKQSLKTLPLKEFVFTTGQGDAFGQVYHNLSDVVGLHYAAGSPKDGKALTKEQLRLVSETTELAIQFVEASDTLLGAVLPDFGFMFVYGKPL